jgi:hypothetical protein
MKTFLVWALLPVAIPLLLLAMIGDAADRLYWRLATWVRSFP